MKRKGQFEFIVNHLKIHCLRNQETQYLKSFFPRIPVASPEQTMVKKIKFPSPIQFSVIDISLFFTLRCLGNLYKNKCVYKTEKSKCA